MENRIAHNVVCVCVYESCIVKGKKKNVRETAKELQHNQLIEKKKGV